MKVFFFALLLILSTVIHANAQSDSIPAKSSSPEKDSVRLLPDKMIITQRILWGENGLMRKQDRFALNIENRQKEIDLRHKMFVAHQVLGYVSLGGMVAQAFIGPRLYKSRTESLLQTHEAVAAGVNICYFGAAALALFAPPKLTNERRGYTGAKAHRVLAIIHLTSMIATNILASQLEGNPGIKPYHRAAAFTAFGSLAAAMLVVKF
jgi:hypothetical protein